MTLDYIPDLPPSTPPSAAPLTQPEWEQHMERAYDRLPDWWWNSAERYDAYQRYLNIRFDQLKEQAYGQ